MRKKTPELPLPLRISSPYRKRTEPRPYATRTEKLIKIAREFPDIVADRQTDSQTDVLITIAYFATAPADEVISLQLRPLLEAGLTLDW